MMTGGVRDTVALWPLTIPLAGSSLALLLHRWPRAQRALFETTILLLVGASALLLAMVWGGAPVTMAFGG